MLFIYNEDRVECIQLNIDVKEQYKHLFSRYASNFAFFNIQTSKESSDCHRTFVNIELLRNLFYFSFFNISWMKVFRSLAIRNHDKKKKHWSDKAFQTSVENFYFYYDDFMIESFDLNHVVKV